MGNHTFYTGQKLREPAQTAKEGRPDIYIPPPGLVEAVNLAHFLKRPLLLMGEPGSGKTQLATSVAYDLWEGDFHKHLFRWDIKSTTTAKEGLYRYDALKHLRDFNFDAEGTRNLSPEGFRDRYLKDGRIGEVFRATHNEVYSEAKPPVLLIDEVDKADIDFPNDLLMELEERVFKIEEGKYSETVKAKFSPFIVITSNREKELPPAFLRRCVFYFIKFPEKDDLKEIVTKNFGVTDENLTEAGLSAFLAVRTRLESVFSTSEKNVSTSELKDWFKKLVEQAEQRATLVQQLIALSEKLKKGEQVVLPYYQVLLKNWDAVNTLLLPPKK